MITRSTGFTSISVISPLNAVSYLRKHVLFTELL